MTYIQEGSFEMAGESKDAKTRFNIYQIIFTVVLCLIPLYVFLWYTIYAVLIGVLIKLIEVIWRRMSDTTIDPSGRGLFISGCDSGFGFTFAQHFDEMGYTVFAGCLNEKGDGARKLQKECSKRLPVVGIDVSKDTSVANAFMHVKKNLPRNGLWGVVNNAGINMFGEVELKPVSSFESGFNVNLYGPIRVIHQFLSLVRHTQGRVINITSVHGRYSLPNVSTYDTSKHSMETLSDSLRLEMKKFGVGVSVVEPGMYGRNTSISNEASFKRATEDAMEMWDQASPEVKKSYSKEYFLSCVPKPFKEVWPPQEVDLSPVIMAVEHALCSGTPQTRYMVGGEGPLGVDSYAMLARVYNIVPTWIIDKYVATAWKLYKRTK